MLHEILMALAGHPGDVVHLSCEESNADVGTSSSSPKKPLATQYTTGFHINTALDFISAAERDILNRIVSVGYDFAIVKDFIEMVKRSKFDECPSEKGMQKETESNRIRSELPSFEEVVYQRTTEQCPRESYQYGLYISAICSCMEQILALYLKIICTLEKKIMADPMLPVSFLLISIQQQRNELQTMRHFIEKYCSFDLIIYRKENIRDFESMYVNRISCGKLLDYLWQGRKSGNPVVQHIYQRFFESCGRVFVFQLCGWLLHGQLVDPNWEFFIQRRAFIDSSEFSHHNISRINSVSEDLSVLLTPHGLHFEWGYLFYLKMESIPRCCMSIDTARKALFIGKVMRLLTRSRCCTNAEMKELSTSVSLLDKSFAIGVNAMMAMETAIEEMRIKVRFLDMHCGNLKSSGLTECLILDHSFFVLSSFLKTGILRNTSPGFLERLENIIRCALQAAHLLWHLVVREAFLLLHLKVLKDFFLLGNGPFFQVFIESSWNMMQKPISKRTESDLQIVAWHNAMGFLEESLSSSNSPSIHNEGIFQRSCESVAGNAVFSNGQTFAVHSEDACINKEIAIARRFQPKLGCGGFELDSFPSLSSSQSIITLGGYSTISNSKLRFGIIEQKPDSQANPSAMNLYNAYSCCWYNQKQRISHGFVHGLDFALDISSGPAKMVTPSQFLSSSGGRFAIIFQNDFPPFLFKRDGHCFSRTFWPRIGGGGICRLLNGSINLNAPSKTLDAMLMEKALHLGQNEWKQNLSDEQIPYADLKTKGFRSDQASTLPVLLLSQGRRSWKITEKSPLLEWNLRYTHSRHVSLLLCAMEQAT
ncbi:Spc97 / Spc98 family protein [Cardiosporidium cionae]|uniref:Spindle pole body component n=1 Tax=Cardiosporidium cionae TaxID=476202 RepID=A0ABQ7JEZ6_9APIC|nr:Spc97 / Spc98 family protein [Cardiosporidium cionae]|eukprot:KAF8822220.1 Spc97 / Spc98 family protein [Cardiosporidium cionae]